MNDLVLGPPGPDQAGEDDLVSGPLPVAPRIASVEAAEGAVVQVTFEDGAQRSFALGDRMGLPVFAPLREVEEFDRVQIAPHRRAIEWPSGADVPGDAIYFQPSPPSLELDRREDRSTRSPEEPSRLRRAVGRLQRLFRGLATGRR